MGRLFLLFLIVPIVELALLLEVGAWIGAGPTVLVIVATALVGSRLAAGQGMSVWRSVERALAAGRMPGAEIVDGFIVLLSGALLLTPGILTDVVGLLGLLPFTRPWIRRAVLRRLRRGVESGGIRVAFGGPSARYEDSGPIPPYSGDRHHHTMDGSSETGPSPSTDPGSRTTVSGSAAARPTFEPEA